MLSFTPKSLWKPHEAVLRDLKEALDNTESGTISTQNLVKLAKFVLKNHYYEFKGKVKQQLSSSAIGTKFAPTCICIFMDRFESEFIRP